MEHQKNHTVFFCDSIEKIIERRKEEEKTTTTPPMSSEREEGREEEEREKEREEEEGVFIVFLDVDGVLNAGATNGIEKELVQNLSKLMANLPNPKIVVSSTWRYLSQPLSLLLLSLEREGIEREKVISFTPDLASKWRGPCYPNCSHFTRTDEILLWLLANSKQTQQLAKRNRWVHNPLSFKEGRVCRSLWVLASPITISGFLCIDDIPLFDRSCFSSRAKMKDHLIQTNLSFGFHSQLVDPAISKAYFESSFSSSSSSSSRSSSSSPLSSSSPSSSLSSSSPFFCPLSAPQTFFQWSLDVYGPCTNPDCAHLSSDKSPSDSFSTNLFSQFS